ncbi:hypothetical protein J2X31_001252 [Flavobacterium arsenatis]|uniref:Uncharacterized protein n=1 Tax=Flavobacterium arsenatis TaxID=1484332 RepID=A0ABU1TMQ6_9FLAO|nr:hypothetical protein [Flavobacterium arsenatis]MDR6967245.1 hypothetical protein [Flavobacterium arsenatis]
MVLRKDRLRQVAKRWKIKVGRCEFEVKSIRKKLTRLALIVVESLEGEKPIFSWQKRATNGSSFFDVEKKVFDKSLERKAGIASKKVNSFESQYSVRKIKNKSD